MPRPSPATAGPAFLLAGCGPNGGVLSAFRYGSNLANIVTGIAKGALGHAGARGLARAAASP